MLFYTIYTFLPFELISQQMLHIQSIYISFSLRVTYPCLVAKYYIVTLQRQAIKVSIMTNTFAHIDFKRDADLASGQSNLTKRPHRCRT